MPGEQTCLETLADAVRARLSETRLAAEQDGTWWADVTVADHSVLVYLYGDMDYAGDPPWSWAELSDEEYETAKEDPREIWPNYVDYLSDETGREVEADLRDAGLAASFIRHDGASRIGVRGWWVPVSWVQEGDLLKFWKWKTPLRVARVKACGDGVPVGVPVDIGEDGRTLVLAGARGGRYVVHAPAAGDEWYFYQRPTSDSAMFERTHVNSHDLVFVGNPETGPRDAPPSSGTG